MTAVLLGLGWAAVVAGGLRRARPPAERVARLRVRRARPPRGVACILGTAMFRIARRRAATPQAAARVGRVAIALALPLAVVPLPLGAGIGVAAGAGAWVQPIAAARTAERRRHARIEADLPDVVDLLVLAVGAGLTVPLALDAVARRAEGELADELGRVVVASQQGHRLADALDELPRRAGEGVRPLVAALVASERYGAPLAAGLERLAGEIRAARRRRASEAAQRVSVNLLFPLVLCILPAFALLTVAPLIASALKSLRL